MVDENSKQNISRRLVIKIPLLVILVIAFIIGGCAETKSENDSYFPVERGNIRVYQYLSRHQAQNEVVVFQIESYEQNGRIINRYLLDYYLDPQKPGQIGFVFIFKKPLDFSKFSNIRLKSSIAPLKPLWVRVSDGVKDVKIKISQGNYGSTGIAREQEISIPFSAFNNIDWKSVSVLNFYVDIDTTPNAPNQQFSVDKIKFVK